ncbi:hypothetical protein [Amycolatopsis sp. FDAARGOS 1241]|uniref:hypothetical protein n=1 Tax=Amycolatopsis sp. FDAARGOS 1241 TaxID=2778070 RepID=UPI00194DD684|nr:hypothetical protein [Amycolatopsis sp. FDAARGOS 1241]QRP44751.1 hypothetical protein I6J71_36815 [Amycolatopsis sp. FDAARGOS 1241]
MALLGFCEDDEYLPDHGTVVVRDVYREDSLPSPANELLGELATTALSGTVATAGDGWLHGTTGDPYQAIRCEAHDGPPAVRPEDWEEIVETPFHSRSGAVGLGGLTGGTYGDELDLGAKGLFRARVCRKPAAGGEEGDVWLIQFWPVPGIPEAPRWLKRTRAAVHRPDPGWQQVLGYHVIEVSWFFTLAGMKRPDGWLDEPLPGNSQPPDSVCAQLGIDPPRTRRDAIPLLVAAGLLADDGAGGFSAGTPRPATEVLDLPDILEARLKADALRTAYIWLASDLTSIAAWSNPAHIEDLAALLAVPAETVEPLLEFAVSELLIHRTNRTVTALPRPAPRPQPVRRLIARSVHREEPVTVAGAPPRAGFVAGDGTVVVWRAGEPVVLGRVDSDYRYRAFETPAGIYIAASAGQGQLVTWAGARSRLPVDLDSRPVRSADGRHLAGVQVHTGRHPWDQVHFFDVTTEEVWSLPRSEGLTRYVVGIHDGAVYFSTRSSSGAFTSSRWVPGREPVALASPVHRLDPLSGATVREEAEGMTVFTASGERRQTLDTQPGRFVPGGASLYSFQHTPPTLALLELATDTRTRHPLPAGCEVGEIPPMAPIWESPDTLVFSQPHHASTRRIIRWHPRRDAFEHFDLPELAGYRPFPIEPMLA